jgi:two-component system invasion response regulator UvrY
MMTNILIIDDSVDNLFILERLIKVFNPEINILEAINGEHGIKIFDNEDIDTVICDFEMPGINGVETLKRILSINKSYNLKTFIFTASDDCNDDDLKGNKYYYGIKKKPIDADKIREMIT